MATREEDRSAALSDFGLDTQNKARSAGSSATGNIGHAKRGPTAG